MISLKYYQYKDVIQYYLFDYLSVYGIRHEDLLNSYNTRLPENLSKLTLKKDYYESSFSHFLEVFETIFDIAQDTD